MIYLRKVLDRLLGRVLDFGCFSGWSVEAVPRDYLAWCLNAIPLRAEVRTSIRRVLDRPVVPRRPSRTHRRQPLVGGLRAAP